jgi:hypothetical protein
MFVGFISANTFMPPIVDVVFADTRPGCIQCRSSLVAPPAVAGGISGSTIMSVYVPTSCSVVPIVGAVWVSGNGQLG